MNVLDLFSGIGGFSIGLERAGMKTVAFCEIEEYPRKVLAKHWPGVPIYNDVRALTHDRLKSDGIPRIDVITGGFPCQDISVAGKQAGIEEGTRSGLWSECARLLGEIRPDYAIFENVTALLSGDNGRWFQRVLWDISQVGYNAEWHCIPASELGAYHHRDRVWIVAYPNSKRLEKFNVPTQSTKEDQFDRECYAGVNAANSKSKRFSKSSEQADKSSESSKSTTTRGSVLADSISKRQQGQREYVKPLLAEAIRKWQTINAESGCISGIWSVEPQLGRVANGIPDRAHRLKGLGNAVVPQIPELIGRAIMSI